VVDTSSTLANDTIEAAVPVRNAFGLSEELPLATDGHAHCTSSLSGMQLIPLQEHAEIVAQARIRKHLDERLPTADAFTDKL
jgi:translation elongation factor EF-G